MPRRRAGCYGCGMNQPASETDAIIERLVDAQRRGRADDLLLKRAERVAAGLPDAWRLYITGMVAALRMEEEAAMRAFEAAVRLRPGEFAPAWNRAVTACMFGRWRLALDCYADMEKAFPKPEVRQGMLEMMRFCGMFDEAAQRAREWGMDTPDAAFAAIAEAHGLRPERIEEMMNRAGAFLRGRGLPVLKTWMGVLDDEEGVIEACIRTPAREALDADYVAFLEGMPPLPAEESAIIIGFEPPHGDELARAA